MRGFSLKDAATLLPDFAKSRIARGTLVGVAEQFLQISIQFFSVAIFSKCFGLEGLGVWLLLFTIPSFLTFADLGFTTAGGNEMTISVAKGNLSQASNYYAALRCLTAVTSIIIFAASFIFFNILFPNIANFAEKFTNGHANFTIMILVCYGLLALYKSVLTVAFRANDNYAFGGLLGALLTGAEALAALSTAAAGGSPVLVASVYLASRVVGNYVMQAALKRRAIWVRTHPRLPTLSAFRELINPSLAALALPGAYAISLQGAVVVIGIIGGPSAVPAFTVVRTLTRTALQFAMILNLTSMTRFTVSFANNDERRMGYLIGLNIAICVPIVVIGAIVIHFIAQKFIDLWSHHVIVADDTLVTTMIIVMVANILWTPIANFLLAINRHSGYSFMFLLVSAASIVLGGALMHQYAATGMALGLLAGEMIMIAWVWREFLNSEIFEYLKYCKNPNNRPSAD